MSYYEFVMQTPGKKWNYKLMSQNPNISMKDIDNSTHLPWNYQLLGNNPSITWDDIQEKNDVAKYNWGGGGGGR
jgi:hypothetical protein